MCGYQLSPSPASEVRDSCLSISKTAPMQTLTTESPKAALPLIRDSPATNGILEMIVR